MLRSCSNPFALFALAAARAGGGGLPGIDGWMGWKQARYARLRKVVVQAEFLRVPARFGIANAGA